MKLALTESNHQSDKTGHCPRKSTRDLRMVSLLQTIMPVTLEIIPIPIGSQLVRSIGNNAPDDLNDFDALLLFSENVNLTRSGVFVSAGSSIVAFEGKNSVYKVTIRPPQTSWHRDGDGQPKRRLTR